MRPVAAIPLLLVLVAVGCGGGEETAATGSARPEAIGTPSQQQREAAASATPPPIPAERIPLAVRRQLERGEIGLLDAFGQTRIRPDRVDFAQDASLEDVDWAAWGAEGARGTGTLRFNDCDPNCAEGSIKTVQATMTLRAPKACKGQRYFSESAVVPGSGPTPRSYVRAPC